MRNEKNATFHITWLAATHSVSVCFGLTCYHQKANTRLLKVPFYTRLLRQKDKFTDFGLSKGMMYFKEYIHAKESNRRNDVYFGAKKTNMYDH